jgi:ribosomal protein S12 methylthiotransferase
MIARLSQNDFEYTADPEEADLIIVNTCGFVEDAKNESIRTTLQFKDKYPGKKVFMAGCLTQRYKDVLSEELTEIDGFVGTSGPLDIVRIVSGSEKGGENYLHNESGPSIERTRFLSFPGSAYVKISEGCNNGCSYCAIPLIRGSLASREVGSVANEIKALYANGIREMNLVAQDCGSFGADRGRVEIGKLLDAISAMPGDLWVRLLYVHPDHFPYEILDAMNRDKRIVPYFDIPFQHASVNVLSRMGRKGNPDTYLDLIRKIRETCSDAVIRSTFLVGFPGETDSDFDELVRFQENAMLDWAGVFCYSREEGTRAFDFGSRVAKRQATARKKILEENQARIIESRLDRFVGKEIRVLIEEEVKEENLYLARGYMHAPEVDGLVVLRATGLAPGIFADARIIRRNGIDLEAEQTT